MYVYICVYTYIYIYIHINSSIVVALAKTMKARPSPDAATSSVVCCELLFCFRDEIQPPHECHDDPMDWQHRGVEV